MVNENLKLIIMIKVYFENGKYSELVAIFESEDLYIVCLPALQKKAKESNMIVTESIIE